MEIPIDEILEGYTVSAPERSVRKQVAAVINDVVGVSVPFKSVSYQKGKIRVDVSPLVRSQIHIHKEKILKQLAEDLKNRNIKDLR